ncbi:hypothetical protein BU200_01700 [Streptococcus acidominimus]|uniref:Uncharacterized protein n=1 Tax=Streptococcus acidominimus TaxID=1326 RepID=A0A1Q8EFA8_STRAI|nr:hypothetical protein BU200_01700 [Streptococcus acidominimus]SUN05465.1 Uncharacterised protein [Streptococcus acidominimus]
MKTSTGAFHSSKLLFLLCSLPQSRNRLWEVGDKTSSARVKQSGNRLLKKVGDKTSSTRVKQSRNRLWEVGDKTSSARVKCSRILFN